MRMTTVCGLIFLLANGSGEAVGAPRFNPRRVRMRLPRTLSAPTPTDKLRQARRRLLARIVRGTKRPAPRRDHYFAGVARGMGATAISGVAVMAAGLVTKDLGLAALGSLVLAGGTPIVGHGLHWLLKVDKRHERGLGRYLRASEATVVLGASEQKLRREWIGELLKHER